LCPTFQESFGYAILEAMAFGLPVISTNYFAIPEMVSHDVSGYTIDIKDHSFIQNFTGYTLEEIPADFSDYMKSEIIKYCSELITDSVLRNKMSQNALNIVKTKFSFESRNALMDKIYTT
jgi:glycosyltransferase involved in cell wall biosynthesis